MAWEHFTDWLEPGQIITKAQRDELLDAIKERIGAIPTLEITDSSIEATVVDVGIDVAQVPVAVSGEESIFYLHELIEVAAIHYVQAESYGSANWSSVTLWTEAADDLGISSYSPILAATEAGLSTAAYWNLLRRGVQLLKIAQWELTTSRTQKWYPLPGNPPASWSLVRTNMPGASESFVFSFVAASTAAVVATKYGTSPDVFVALGQRVSGSRSVPSLACFSNYSAFTFVDFVTLSGVGFVSSPFRWAWGSAYSDSSVAGPAATQRLDLTGLSAVGPQELSFFPTAYVTSSAIDAYQPASVGASLGSGAVIGSWVYVKPTFTRP